VPAGLSLCCDWGGALLLPEARSFRILDAEDKTYVDSVDETYNVSFYIEIQYDYKSGGNTSWIYLWNDSSGTSNASFPGVSLNTATSGSNYVATLAIDLRVYDRAIVSLQNSAGSWRAQTKDIAIKPAVTTKTYIYTNNGSWTSTSGGTNYLYSSPVYE